MKKDFMSAMINTKASIQPPMYSQSERIKKDIVILDKIKKFIPELTSEEKLQLEKNIVEYGCKDPLIVWETTRESIGLLERTEQICYVLIDGHNRYEICQKFNIDFKVSVVELDSFDSVFDFMIDHQLGRRNLSLEQMSYLRGIKYLSLKKNEVQRDKSGKFLSEVPSGQNDHSVKKTLSEQLAEQFNVGEKTIRRDAEFAKGVDMLPAPMREAVLSGRSSLKKKDVVKYVKKDSKENDDAPFMSSGQKKSAFLKDLFDRIKHLRNDEDFGALIIYLESNKGILLGDVY